MPRTRAGLANPVGKREVYGPLAAVWEIVWSDSPGCSSTRCTLDGVRGELAYFIRQGRHLTATPTITRVETCPMSGCTGDGMRSVRRRGSMFATDVACVGCRGRHETAEDLAPLRPIDVRPPAASLSDVLAQLGLGHAPAEYGRRMITQNGWPLFSGTAGAVWDWLLETGRIV